MNNSITSELQKLSTTKIAFCFFLTATVFMLSCKGKNEAIKEEVNTIDAVKKKAISAIDIKNAQSLIITNAENTSDSTNLKKITNDGNIKDVFYSNEDGTSSNKSQGHIKVDKMIKLSENYMVLYGSFSFSIYQNEVYTSKNISSILVRRSDGAIFDFGNFDFDTESHSFNSQLYRPSIFFDKDSNIFYRSIYNGRKSITKLSLKTPDKLLKEDYLPNSQNIIDATVDKFGNIAYSINENDPYRLKSISGEIAFIQGGIPLDLKSTFVNEFWTGNNGKLYISGYDKALPYISIIDTENGNKQTKVWTGANCMDYYPNSCRTASKWEYMRFFKGNELIFISLRGYLETLYIDIWTFNETTNQIIYNVKTIPNIDVSQFKPIGKSKTGLYFITKNNEIYKYTFENNTIVKHNNTSLTGFEISSINVNYNDNISLLALRYLDGKDIIGQINTFGDFEIITDQLRNKPLFLERLN
ncbi:hypothetical protein [Pseudopedobacter beijingensis]|uniref:TolB-like 6-blade propeller-like n=1 Tax=Pseudopedobacter beijingensis TaxID=1207056 RepID=A0ABW4IG54_9SPHI